jgi:hypothetical protein
MLHWLLSTNRAMLPLLPTVAFSAQLLPLLFLINMPELFRHLLFCYLWFVNMMFAGRNQNDNSARVRSTGRKTFWEAKEIGRLELQACVVPWLKLLTCKVRDS